MSSVVLSVALPFACVHAQPVSLSLQQCLDMSAGGNVNVRNAELDILAAKAQKKEALAEYFPSVSAAAFGFHALDPMLEIGVKDILGDNDFSNNLQNILQQYGAMYGFDPVFKSMQYGYSANLMAIQTVCAGGRVVTGNRLAALGVEAASLQKDIALRSNAEEVEKAYWQVVALDEKMQVLHDAMAMVDNLHKDVSAAVSAGLALDTDLMQVELKRNELRSSAIQLRNGIRLSKMNVLNMIGAEYSVISGAATQERPYIDDISFSDRLGDISSPEECYMPEEEIAASLDEMQLLDLSVEAKKMERRMTLGEALPSVALGASYGYSQMINGRANGNVFAMISVPITDWGKISRKMQRQEYEISKADNEREYLSAQLQLQVRQLWMNLTAAWEQMEVARYGVELAQKTEENLAVQYESGMIALSELLQAQTALSQARNKLVDMTIDYKNARTEYLGRVRTDRR